MEELAHSILLSAPLLDLDGDYPEDRTLMLIEILRYPIALEFMLEVIDEMRFGYWRIPADNPHVVEIFTEGWSGVEDCITALLRNPEGLANKMGEWPGGRWWFNGVGQA